MSLEDFQQYLIANNIPAFFVTMHNMFIGQDILPEENKIRELTGFTGSAGILLVSHNNVWLLVDGRYSIQARQQVDSDKVTVVDSKDMMSDLARLCRENNIETLGYNPWSVSIRQLNSLKNALGKISLSTDSEILGKGIADKSIEVFAHDIKYAGKTTEEKCTEIINNLSERFSALLICAADKVSWLANLRSYTLQDTPILRAWALLERSGKLTIYADNCSYPNIKPFNELSTDLQAYDGQCILADAYDTPSQIFALIPECVKLDTKASNPLTSLKLAKNPTELTGFKNAHIRDGVAVVKFMYWLEQQDYHQLSEWDIVVKLRQFRAKQELFFSDSFATIAAAGANAAVVHYQPTEDKNSQLQADSVLLIDSGAQYYDGTTDVTRTIAIGNPSTEIKNSFTEVLKAHIALSSAVFPVNTNANLIDSLARLPLWQQGKDFKHGTGHSVGHFSNVHESPLGISPTNRTPIRENYITSIEPGYYKEGEYGIRIENLVYATRSEFDGYLTFANLTLIPIDKSLINTYLLSSGEQVWLNNYHQHVFDCLAIYLDKEEKEWLKKACSPL